MIKGSNSDKSQFQIETIETDAEHTATPEMPRWTQHLEAVAVGGIYVAAVLNGLMVGLSL